MATRGNLYSTFLVQYGRHYSQSVVGHASRRRRQLLATTSTTTTTTLPPPIARHFSSSPPDKAPRKQRSSYSNNKRNSGPQQQQQQRNTNKNNRNPGNDIPHRRSTAATAVEDQQARPTQARPKVMQQPKMTNHPKQQQQRPHDNRIMRSPVENILSANSSYSDSSYRSEMTVQQDVAASNGGTEEMSFSLNSSSSSSSGHEHSHDKPQPQTYAEIIDGLAAGTKFRRQHTKKPVSIEEAAPVEAYLRREEPLDASFLLEPDLPTLTYVLEQRNQDNNNIETHLSSEELSKQLVSEIHQQRQRFMEKMEWSDRQYEMMQDTLFRGTSLCAKHGMGEPADMIWHKIKEAGILNKRFLELLLHITSTFVTGNRRKRAIYGKYAGGGSILHILDGPSFDNGSETNMSASDKKSLDDDMVETIDEIAVYHDLNFEPTEQSLLVRTRLLIAQGNARDAENLLNQYGSNATLHLRSFMPILRMYLEQGDLASSLRVYRKMTELRNVILDSEVYVHLIAGMAEHGGFHPSAPPIENAASLGFQSTSGPGLLDDLLSEMKGVVIDIPVALARRLRNAFAESFPDSGLEKLTSLAPLKIKEDAVQDDERVLADLVPIDHRTGLCGRTGIRLRLEQLSDSQVEQLKEGIFELAKDRQDKFVKEIDRHKKANRRGEAVQLLESFFDWLDCREGEPFTVIIDGPNVAYYMQNFETGRFSYHQIQFVIDHLESLGERPLVILPRKYTLDFFSVTVGPQSGIGAWKQRLTSAEKRIRTNLMDSGNIAVIPPGFLDDYYWILASVSEQTVSRQGRDLTVAPDDPHGRWPGIRPVLITNDMMRDHRLGLLEPMLFRRWYSNYIVNYNFPAFVGKNCSHPEIGFSPAGFFSHEIQRNELQDGSSVWHFPVSDQQDVWFCLSIRGAEKR